MTFVRELPEPLINKYRTVQLERLDRLEGFWLSLREKGHDPRLEQALARGLESLKGDSRALGFSDVSFLCQKLEDLLFFARQRRYEVPDELDMLVTMALQFMGLLIKRGSDQKPARVDLKGFVRQLEEVLRNAQASPAQSPPASAGTVEANEHISASTRQRLARVATDLYLESLNAWGPSVTRLRASWEALVKEVATLEAVSLETAFGPSRQVALAQAQAVGKPLEILLDVGGHRAVAEVALALKDAVDISLRLAVEKGIEPLALRTQLGKREVGTLRVRAREEGDRLEVVVEDDGRGADLEAIRRRAAELGLWPAGVVNASGQEELLELLFQPGFLQDEGKGLHEVRQVVERTGGTVELWSRTGVGASVVLRAPRVSRVVEVLRLSLPGSPLAFAVPSTWSVSHAAPMGEVPRLEPLGLLGLPRGEEPGRRERVWLRRQEEEVELMCRGRPMLGKAERICPTDEEAPVEVVRIAGDEALLLRPERLLALAAAHRP